MAARNRPRGGLVKEDPADAHEERNMWNQIVSDLKRLKGIHARAAEVSAAIVDMESRFDGSPSLDELDSLAVLYREGIRLSEDEQKILNEEPNDVIKNVGILTALRTASEIEPPRNSQPSKSRNPKRQKLDMDGAADSPGPSPGVASSTSRLKGSSVRSGSVPSNRDVKESSVKIEDIVEVSKGASTERMGKLVVGTEVAYKQVKMKDDGSQWIQCIIISVTDVGNKKRYEVQDPEPDENGAPGQIYKTFAAALIAIPPADAILADHSVGKHVLARYPETTTFYRAKVMDVMKDSYKLEFEEDQGNKTEVSRRFVLDFNSK